MTEQKSPLEQALDMVLYAPLGLALTAKEELPRLIDKGRQRVTTQVAMARMIGQFALAQGQHEFAKVAKQAGDALVGLGIVGDQGAKPRPAHAPPPGAGADAGGATGAPGPAGASGRAAGSGGAGVAASNGKPSSAGAGTGPSSEELAIPGYDSLSASQVVQRLAGLAPGELEAVRGYEASTRGRRTILNRISQLQTGVG